MRQYELMVIVDPEVDDRQVSTTIDKFLQVVKNDGGTVDKVDVWGRRRLAYPIKKKDEGSYVVANFTSEPATAKGWTVSSGCRVDHAHQAAARRRLILVRTPTWQARPPSPSSAT